MAELVHLGYDGVGEGLVDRRGAAAGRVEDGLELHAEAFEEGVAEEARVALHGMGRPEELVDGLSRRRPRREAHASLLDVVDEVHRFGEEAFRHLRRDELGEEDLVGKGRGCRRGCRRGGGRDRGRGLRSCRALGRSAGLGAQAGAQRRHAVPEDRGSFGRDGSGLFIGVVPLDEADHRPQGIDGLVDDIEGFLAYRRLLLEEDLEKRFRLVREELDVLETEEARGTLYRMEEPEDGIQAGDIVARPEAFQLSLGVVKPLVAFGDERYNDLPGIVVHVFFHGGTFFRYGFFQD